MIDRRGKTVRFAPRVPSWQLSRRRLTDRVERGIHDGLVILRGAAGGGKTLVLAEWADAMSRNGTWVTVHDANATRFALWEHVLRSVGSDRSREALGGIEGRSESNLRLALEECFAGEPHVLVLDDYHLVPGDGIHEDVAWLVQHTPCSVVLVTRSVSLLESGLLAARLGPTLIGPDELAFSREETRAVLAGLPTTVADAAYERLAGWPLATRSLALELARRGPMADLEDAVRAVAVTMTTDHPALPAALSETGSLDFAVRVALPDWLTVDLASALVPGVDAGRMLERFEVAGLGTWAESPGGAAFRFQAFARTALLTQAEALSADERDGLRREYATWADAAGHSVVAGRQAVALADWPMLAAIAQRHFRRLMRLHRPEWTELLSAVPFDRIGRHPVLGAVLIQLLNADSGTSDRMRAIATVLLNSIGPLRERGSVPDRIWRNASALAAERVAGRYVAAATTAERLTALIGALSPDEFVAVQEFLPLLYVHIGTTRLYAGDAIGAIEPLDEALRTEADTQWSHLHARSLLALIAALRGELPLAARHADAIEREITIPGWRGTYSAAGYHLARAIAHIEAFNADAARAEVGLLDRHFDTIEHWPLILLVRAQITLIEGSAEAAAATLSEQIRLRSRRSQTSAAMRALLAGTQADLFTAAGELGAAQRALPRTDHADSPTVMMAAARAALAAGDNTKAGHLSRRTIGPGGASPRTLAGSLLIRAVARHRSGRSEEAAVSLTQAIDVLERHDLRMPLALVPRGPLESLSRESGTQLPATPILLHAAAPTTRLTTRELAVLAELDRTASVQAIAQALFVSPNTVKTQIRSLYRKLGVSTRAEAISVAHAAGLIPRR